MSSLLYCTVVNKWFFINFSKTLQATNCKQYNISICKQIFNHKFHLHKQAISACGRALCQLTVSFGFQSDRRKGHKSCTLQMVIQKESNKVTVEV